MQLRAAVAGELGTLLNFSMRLRMRLRAAVAGYVGVIAAKYQRNLFQAQLRLGFRPEYELALTAKNFSGVRNLKRSEKGESLSQ